MIDFSRICPNCCKESGDGGGYCPVCGIDAASIENEEFCIPAGSVLLDRYFIGRVIGQGGFGITYLAYDIKLKTKIALKEYFPHGYAFRELHKDKHTVYSLTGEKTEFYNRGIEKFVAEAQRLAQFSGAPGIVNVRDYFNENNTAYIVMEFVEGEPLAALLERRERLSESEVTEIFLPILKTLQRVHSAGILHRDIAPDNIMVEPDGTARLIDFGSSAEIDENAATSAAVIKHYYVPEEQYDNNRRRQGPWTDVYAISATIFRALEGQTLPDALERLRGMPFDGFTVSVSAPVKKAVIHGLALFQKDRTQSVDELIAAFSAPAGTAVYKKPKAPKVPKTVAFEAEKPKTSPKKLAAIIGGIAATLAVVCLVIFLPRASVPTAGETVTAGETTQNTQTTAADVTTTTTTTTTTALNETYVENRDYTLAGIGSGKYTGGMQSGKPEGKGVLTMSGGGYYDGDWKNGRPEGQGKMVFAGVATYTGGWKAGQYDGEGTLELADGSKYVGGWKAGQKNGKGKEYSLPDRDDQKPGTFGIDEGTFVNGNLSGDCTFTYQGNDFTHVEYSNWEERNTGTFTIHSVKTYNDGGIDEWDDVFINNQWQAHINDKRTAVEKDVKNYDWGGGKYTGHLKDGSPDGQGTIIYNDGNKYVGGWKDGQYSGKGTYYQLSDDNPDFKKGNLEEQTGNFKDGYLVGDFTCKNYYKDGGWEIRYWSAADDGHWLGSLSEDGEVILHWELYNAAGKKTGEFDEVFKNNEIVERRNEKNYE
jgi:serine/threonine protein kinase